MFSIFEVISRLKLPEMRSLIICILATIPTFLLAQVKPNSPNTTYKIQFFASENCNRSFFDVSILGAVTSEYIIDKGVCRYYCGVYPDLRTAGIELNKVWNLGYRDAFLVQGTQNKKQNSYILNDANVSKPIINEDNKNMNSLHEGWFIIGECIASWYGKILGWEISAAEQIQMSILSGIAISKLESFKNVEMDTLITKQICQQYKNLQIASDIDVDYFIKNIEKDQSKKPIWLAIKNSYISLKTQ